MPNFRGFSTINKDKKFTLTDRDLIKRDLLNAFELRAGSVVGRPEVGTTIWDYIFDPNDTLTANRIEAEIRRIIGLDERLELHDVVVTNAVNTIRAHVSVSIATEKSSEDFYITFVEATQTATIS